MYTGGCLWSIKKIKNAFLDLFFKGLGCKIICFLNWNASSFVLYFLIDFLISFQFSATMEGWTSDIHFLSILSPSSDYYYNSTYKYFVYFTKRLSLLLLLYFKRKQKKHLNWLLDYIRCWSDSGIFPRCSVSRKVEALACGLIDHWSLQQTLVTLHRGIVILKPINIGLGDATHFLQFRWYYIT